MHKQHWRIFSSSKTHNYRIINSTGTVDLFFEELGNHTVSVDTSDRAGNPASETIPFRVIATKESIISDIQRAFLDGWIDNKGIEESLAQKVQRDRFREFIKELEAQRNKHINDQAFEILIEDINWVLSH